MVSSCRQSTRGVICYRRGNTFKMGDPILQESLGSLVANQLRQRIWNKEIQFGERLIESDLSEQFGVSRNTIRDALKILEYEEMVVSKPRKGTYVSQFSNKDWREMIELRTIIESYAFVKALPHLDEKHFKKLEKTLDQMKIIADNKDWAKLFDLDMKFHSYIVKLSGNSRIIKIYESIQVQIRTFLVHLDKYYSSHISFYEEQKELFETLLTKDPEKIKEKIRTHIEYVEGQLLADD